MGCQLNQNRFAPSRQGDSFRCKLICPLSNWLLVLVSLVLSACSQSGSTVPTVDTLESGKLGSISTNADDPDSVSMVDPRSDGWDTEALSAEAQEQLKGLVKYLAHPAEFPLEQLTPLIADEFSCGSLRPREGHRVFEEGPLLVRHSTMDNEPSETRFTGTAGLIEAIGQLAEPLQATSAVRTKIKTVGVQADGDHKSTTHLIEVSGERPDGSVELHFTWNCIWEGGGGDRPLRLLSIHARDYEQATLVHPGKTILADCTQAVLSNNPDFDEQLLRGVDYWLDRLPYDLHGVDPTGHRGLAVGDVNGDGLEDIYLCQSGALPNRLYVQQPDGTARDVSASSGVDWLDPSASALLLDLDNDGDQDLVIATPLGVVVMANDGRGKFEHKTSFGGMLAGDQRSTAALRAGGSSGDGGFSRRGRGAGGAGGFSMSAADYDQDGDIDIYVCPYGTTADIPLPSLNHATNGAPNSLFRNDIGDQNKSSSSSDDWRFTDVTDQVGMDHNNNRWSFAATWEDYDNDGDPDLYVANDFGPNNLYRNEGGKFRDVAPESGTSDFRAGMSVSWGDFNRDGWMDLYVGNMFSAAGNRIAFQEGFQKTGPDQERQLFQGRASGNSLYQNMGKDGFVDVSDTAGVAMGRWSWSSNFVDLNNDSWEDLVVGNGYYTREDTGDL
jgi:hypothetical protein